MQKIVLIDKYHLCEINLLLQNDWEVVSLHPISTHTTNICETGAYVVLQQVPPKED